MVTIRRNQATWQNAAVDIAVNLLFVTVIFLNTDKMLHDPLAKFWAVCF